MGEAARSLVEPWDDLELVGERLDAATTVDSNVLVKAGPGAGKTHLLVGHAVYLARTQPGNIIALTFSRNAAKELSQRIAGMLHASERRNVVATTIHSYAFRLLETHGYRIGLGRPLEVLESVRDIDALAQEVATETGGLIDDSVASRLQKLLRRRALSDADRAGETVFGRVLERMRETGRLTWEYCIELATQLIEAEDLRSSIQHHDRFILVDEAQDCDRSQLVFLWKLIGGPEGNHTLVAMDPDQSLYAFRDANPEEALRWANALQPRVVELTESYRCPARITLLARAVLNNSVGDLPLVLSGEARFFQGSERASEAKFIADQVRQRIDSGVKAERIAILGRSNYLLEFVQTELDRVSVRYRLSPRTHFSQDETLVVSVLQLLHDLDEGLPLTPLAHKALQDTFEMDDPARQELEARTIHEELSELSEVLEDPRWDAICQIWESSLHPSRLIPEIAGCLQLEVAGDQPLIHLASQTRTVSALLNKIRRGHRPSIAASGLLVATFHGSKGLEFDTVFLLGCEDGIIPDYRSLADEQLVHERRALYVALTRASREVVVTSVKRDGNRTRKPSRFLPFTVPGLWTEIQGLGGSI